MKKLIIFSLLLFINCTIFSSYAAGPNERGGDVKLTQVDGAPQQQSPYRFEDIWSLPFWRYINICRGIEGDSPGPLNFEALRILFDPETIDLHTEMPLTDHQTCWHYLCEVADVETVRHFLSIVEDPFIFTHNFFSKSYCALHFACYGGNREVVQFLLDNNFGQYLNGREGRQGYKTPLFVACQKLHVDVVELLLDSSADITLLNAQGKTVQESMEEIRDLYDRKLQECEASSEEHNYFTVSIEKIERIRELLSIADTTS